MPFAHVNRQEIFYEDSGNTGTPIIFMHGFLMDQSLFDRQVEVLHSQYRCIRWDARGFGQTRWDGKAFDLYDTVNDCLGLMDFLKIDSAILCGMSQGGYAALRAALVSPDRVKALILMSTRAGVDEEEGRSGYREIRNIWKQQGPSAALLENLAQAILGPRHCPNMQEYWQKWIPRWKEISGDAIFHAMNALLDRDEIQHRLKEIKCPALVVHGSEDFSIPVAQGEKLSADLSGCLGLIVAPGAHAVNLTHFETVNPQIIQFLKQII